MDSDDWMIPDLSLSTQFTMEMDRRKVKHIDRDHLEALADKLICDWYLHRNIIDSALGRIRHLEVELALMESIPDMDEPDDHHWRWAKELLSELT